MIAKSRADRLKPKTRKFLQVAVMLGVRLLLLIFVIVLPSAAQTPMPRPGKRQQPRFSLDINLRQGAIHGDTEVPLEVVMTNTSKVEVAYGQAYAPPLWSQFCRFDVRDSKGKQLEQKPSMRQFRDWMTSGPAYTLEPGQKVHVEVLLNRLYDLSRPDKYTVQVLRSDIYSDGRNSASNSVVRSNRVTFVSGQAENKKSSAKPRVSIALSALHSSVEVGHELPVKVLMKNISRKKILIRTWEGTGTSGLCYQGSAKLLCNRSEFASGIEVRNSVGTIVQTTKDGRTLDEGTVFPDGEFAFVWLKPGETYEEVGVVGKLYDLSRPGSYVLQASLFDPGTNVAVKSNPVSVKVLNGEDARLDKKPTFVINIFRHVLECGFGSQICLDTSVTNTSDHAIDFDRVLGVYEVDVYNEDGTLAALTTAGRHYRALLPKSGSLPPTEPPSEHAQRMLTHIQPGTTAPNNRIYLDGPNAIYDLSRSGRYTVQLMAFDVETKQIVESNRLAVVVGH